MNKKRRMAVRISIGFKLMVLLPAAILIAVAIVGMVFVHSAEDALKNRILRSLDAVATAKARRITSLVEQDFERVALIASRTRMRECLLAIQEGAPNTDQLTTEMAQSLHDALHSLEFLQEVSVADATGRVVASTNPSLIGEDLSHAPWFSQAKSSFSLVNVEYRATGLTYDMAAPLRNPKERATLGVIVVRIGLRRLAEVLADRTGLGATGEFILAKRTGDKAEMVGPLRHALPPDATRFLPLDSAIFPPLLLAIEHKEGITVAKDYRGVEVLAAFRHVPVGDWGLVAKIDTQEAFQPIHALRKKVALLGTLLAGIGAFFAYLASRFVSQPIRELQNGVTRIADGQLDYRLNVRSHDEIGELGLAFNQMAARLEKDSANRKQAEEEREQLIAKLEAQNSELDRFTYTVSHDLKSPLITIQGYVGMLLEDLSESDNSSARSDLACISKAADKMGSLLKNLLELSRLGRFANPPELVSLKELANEALELVHGKLEQRGVEIHVHQDLPEVYGDRTRLLQVLQNLIDNAVKYMGDEPEPRIEIGKRQDQRENVFFIRDNGIGIDSLHCERIFELFDQLNPREEGSGIGLALVRRIIQLHGGRIWVESDGDGRGSTFCFTVSASPEMDQLPQEASATTGSQE